MIQRGRSRSTMEVYRMLLWLPRSGLSLACQVGRGAMAGYSRCFLYLVLGAAKSLCWKMGLYTGNAAHIKIIHHPTSVPPQYPRKCLFRLSSSSLPKRAADPYLCWFSPVSRRRRSNIQVGHSLFRLPLKYSSRPADDYHLNGP